MTPDWSPSRIEKILKFFPRVIHSFFSVKNFREKSSSISYISRSLISRLPPTKIKSKSAFLWRVPVLSSEILGRLDSNRKYAYFHFGSTTGLPAYTGKSSPSVAICPASKSEYAQIFAINII